jgi:ketosteroid isomerase-like protein
MTIAREQIAEAYKAFEEAFYKGEADTISRMYTQDAEWLVPEAPVVRGRQAIRQGWASIIGPGGNTVRVTFSKWRNAESGLTTSARSRQARPTALF